MRNPAAAGADVTFLAPPGPAVDAVSDHRELLPLQIEAAVLLDRVLRLTEQLEAERKSLRSRIRERIKTRASTLRGRTDRTGSRSRHTGRLAAVLLKSGLFDPEYYLRRNPDVAVAGVDPVVHYLLHGAAEMRNPGPHFATERYVSRYPDVAKSGLNPLYHFIVRGHSEGRDPGPSSAAEHSAIDAGLDRGALRNAANTASSAVRTSRRLVVYTALFGDYDDLFLPTPGQAESCDFVVFTDRADVPPPWRRAAGCYDAANPFKQNRFYKLLPHRLFPDYEWSLYLDGNIDLRMDPVEFLDRYCRPGLDFFVFRHPRRASILDELAACIEMRKDDAERMVRQVAEYFESGFRHSFALTENNIMLRRHNDPALAALSEAWWDEVRSKSQRDQLSLSYVVEKTGYDGIALFEEGPSLARHHPGLRLRPHRAQLYARDPRDDALA
jgi:hypothetical protein